MMRWWQARRVWLGAWLSVSPWLLAPAPALGQPVVQPLPGPDAAQLNEAMRVLAQEPQSIPALIAAAEASLRLDDADAALAFFRRAEALVPQDGRVKAGLASVMVRQQQPVEALRLFAEAERQGEPMARHAAERGLAHDLVGDNARAQADYALALRQGPDPLVTRRLALSQAIAGNGPAAEATLLPLLQRNDLAAYRTRAFVLAILGKSEEAVTIAQTMLPAQLSGRLAPYLRFMPRLTRQQQAAAANLGTFPAAADIGRENPALAYTPSAPAAQPVRTADARLVPSGAPLGAAQPAAPQAMAPAVAPSVASAPVVAPPNPALISVDVPPSAPLVAAAPSVRPAGLAEAPQPTRVALQQPARVEAAPREAIAAQPAPAPAGRVKLSDAFAEFQRAGPPPAAAQPAAGAVDVTAIQPRREPSPALVKAAAAATATAETAKAAAPKPPPVPSRHWVQVATGRDTKALAFDWRRVKREAGGLLDKPAPHLAEWGETNRLVAGPFPSAAAANDLVAKLKGKDIDAFRFTSSAGEEVKPLG